MAIRDKFIPIIVASPLFLQNLDSTVMATALPAIAESLQVEALKLNLAITCYLLSVAVFLPMSGWCADRFGARRVFCWAIALFSLGSALCGAAQSMSWLVAARVLQGLGGALMVPVGRLILARSMPAALMVSAMVWFTLPPAVGRMVGPLFGGVIVTWTSWRWIFLLNIPFGILSIALALSFIDADQAQPAPPPFDIGGFALLGLGLVCLVGGLEVAGRGLLPAWVSWAAPIVGVLAIAFYYRHSLRGVAPIVDLRVMRHRLFNVSIVGGAPLRIAIGASPFLLPLLFQLGFGLSALDAGLLTMATAAGSLASRSIMVRVINRFGFRVLLMVASGLSAICYMGYGLFQPSTPHALIIAALVFGGLVNSMGMIALQTLGFLDVPKPLMSHGATLVVMSQQLTTSVGVMLGASAVGLAAWWRGGDSAHLVAADFSPAFLLIGLITLSSPLFFLRLRREEGVSLRD